MILPILDHQDGKMGGESLLQFERILKIFRCNNFFDAWKIEVDMWDFITDSKDEKKNVCHSLLLVQYEMFLCQFL